MTLRSARVRCAACRTVIESWRPRDFVRCPCGATYVDGGFTVYGGRYGWEPDQADAPDVLPGRTRAEAAAN
jgi:hypothetical protein